MDWFQIGKGVRQGCILSPCLFNLYAEHTMQNTRRDEAQAGIKISERNINKKAECQRIDAFELCCWRRLLRVPWNTRRSNQSILKKISSEYSLEGLMLKLKLQYFGNLM